MERKKGTGSVPAEEQSHRASPGRGAGPTAPANLETAGARGRGLAVPRATTRSGSFVPYWVPFCDFAEVKVIRAFGEQAPLRIRRA